MATTRVRGRARIGWVRGLGRRPAGPRRGVALAPGQRADHASLAPAGAAADHPRPAVRPRAHRFPAVLPRRSRHGGHRRQRRDAEPSRLVPQPEGPPGCGRGDLRQRARARRAAARERRQEDSSAGRGTVSRTSRRVLAAGAPDRTAIRSIRSGPIASSRSYGSSRCTTGTWSASHDRPSRAIRSSATRVWANARLYRFKIRRRV